MPRTFIKYNITFSMQKQNNPLPKDKVKIDLIVIGNPNSGKTSLIKRYIDGESSFSHFYTPTLGLSLEKKVIMLDNNEITLCIWDTAGQEKFFSLTKNYFKKADGVLVIFDLTDKNSFQRIQKYWIHEVKEKSDEDCTSILIGNKLDLKDQRVVTQAQTGQLSQRLCIKYFQTSAQTGQNVEQAIEHVVRQCLKKVKQSEPRGVQVNIRKQNKKGGNSCFSSSKQYISDLWGKFKK